jgi:hypothetical protein
MMGLAVEIDRLVKEAERLEAAPASPETQSRIDDLLRQAELLPIGSGIERELTRLRGEVEARRSADPRDARIAGLQQDLAGLESLDSQEKTEQEAKRLRTEVKRLRGERTQAKELSDIRRFDRDIARLERRITVLETPAGIDALIEYRKQELETIRQKQLALLSPEDGFQSALGDTVFYWHMLETAAYERFWGTQKYELFKYVSRTLEVARALGIDVGSGNIAYRAIRDFQLKAAQIYEDHTPEEQFEGVAFTRRQDFVDFALAFEKLQADVFTRLLDRTQLPASEAARRAAEARSAEDRAHALEQEAWDHLLERLQ